MQRLPISAVSLAGGELSRDDLRGALERLEVNHAFDDSALDQLYWQLAEINGNWLAKEESKSGAPVRSALHKLARGLAAAIQLLTLETDSECTTTQIFARKMIAERLTKNSDEAHQRLMVFLEHAASVGNAAEIAAADLAQKSDIRGKQRLDWYDDFTTLLIAIAERAKVPPKLGYDDVNETPCGWLFEAAQEIEAFLADPMRSPTIKACGRRLERALARLDESQPQKPGQGK